MRQRGDGPTLRLTDQAAVAVALAKAGAVGGQPSIGHLLVGLATEPDGRAGRRLRERATAVWELSQRVATVPTRPAADALSAAALAAKSVVVDTVALLDAAIRTGGGDVADLLETCGFHRDLDGWLPGATQWFDDPETLGWSPTGDDVLDPVASRVAAVVRAIDGGAVDVVIAAVAAPETDLAHLDPAVLATAAGGLPRTKHWDAGLDAVIAAAPLLSDGHRASVHDLLRAALVAGGEGPRRLLRAAGLRRGRR